MRFTNSKEQIVFTEQASKKFKKVFFKKFSREQDLEKRSVAYVIFQAFHTKIVKSKKKRNFIDP